MAPGDGTRQSPACRDGGSWGRQSPRTLPRVCVRRRGCGGSEHLRVLPRLAGGSGDSSAGPVCTGRAQRAEGPAQAQCRGLPGPARPREAARPGGPRLWGSQQDAGNVWPVPRVGWGCGGCRGRRSAASARPRVQGTESPPSHARQTRLALPVEASPSLAVAPRPQGAPGPAAAPACPTLAGGRRAWWPWGWCGRGLQGWRPGLPAPLAAPRGRSCV